MIKPTWMYVVTYFITIGIAYLTKLDTPILTASIAMLIVIGYHYIVDRFTKRIKSVERTEIKKEIN